VGVVLYWECSHRATVFRGEEGEEVRRIHGVGGE
jgi:hypothetical protein